MKLLQLNMWAGRLIVPITELLDQHQPDFVCFQEAISFNGYIYSLFGTIEELQSKLERPYKEVYFSPGMQFRLMNKFAGWGNCILSQHALSQRLTHYTNLDFVEDFNFDDYDYNVRNFLHCVADLKGGQQIHILTHHGHHIPGHKDGDEETFRQMTELSKYVAALDGPVILSGDFNLAPHSGSLELLNKQLTNLSVKGDLKTTRTRLTDKKEVCDYIFVNDKVKVKQFEALNSLVSDHKALLLDFNL